MDKVTALIVAAGTGSRMGGGQAKQFRTIHGQSVLARAISALASHPRIDSVRVVIGKDQLEAARAAVPDYPIARFVIGGAERAESVAAGLAVIESEIVLVHDAARPFCPPGVIDRLLDALETNHGAVPVLPVRDTLARGDEQLGQAIDRKQFLRVQTPQAFFREDLLYALQEAGSRLATDESQVMVAAGLKVATVPGDVMLEKLTTPAEFELAEQILSAKLVSRSGHGFDVHAFGGPGPLIIGGIRLPHDHGLSGHSDADVVLHAITDALLGAAALGDIGEHFPPSDARWKDAESTQFVAYAAGLVRDAGGIIDHVDCTIICEEPKIGPHREAIRSSVASILRLAEASVSIKATTTERLGFTGRKEGIAAQAIATVRLPAATARRLA